MTVDEEARDDHERREAHRAARAIHESQGASGFMATKAHLMKLQDAGRVASIKKFERPYLEKLKEHVRKHGMAPIILRHEGEGHYHIEDGHHRLAIGREMGMAKLPVVIGERGSRTHKSGQDFNVLGHAGLPGGHAGYGQ
jgi:hypothetical protein